MVLADAIAFLEKTLDAAFAKVSNPNEREIRRSFIHRHACNVHDIAMDVFFLGQRGSFGSVYILMRPALESFINIGAAIALKDYAAQKVLNEIPHARCNRRAVVPASTATSVASSDAAASIACTRIETGS